MTKEDIDRIASEYFDDKESEHEMDEVFDLAKKALEERKEDVLEQIRAEIRAILTNSYDEGVKEKALQIIDKYMKGEQE